MTPEEERLQIDTLLDRIRNVASEYCESFVFIGTIRGEDGTRTYSSWGGDFNGAVGMTARMQERLRQRMIQIDFPDDPPAGDDWKESSQ